VAFIVISMHDRPDLGSVTAHVHAHGVRKGRYGDLWELRHELTPDTRDSRGALLALASWLESALGGSDGSGVPR
jgi:hypothetical protein